MQIGYQFKLVKYQMEHVLQIIMDHQQDNVFKMEQMDIGVQMLQILVCVGVFALFYFVFNFRLRSFLFHRPNTLLRSQLL